MTSTAKSRTVQVNERWIATLETIVADLEWLDKHPDKVKAIKGIDPHKPDAWHWCWTQGGDIWVKAFTLRSAIAAARESA
jgi:hypothetical protein